MDTYRKFGLDNPRTYRSRYALDSAVKKFERSTGIKCLLNSGGIELGWQDNQNAIRDLTAAIAELRAAFAADTQTTQQEFKDLAEVANDLRQEVEDLEKAGEDLETVTRAETAAAEAELAVMEKSLKVLRETNDEESEAVQTAKEDIRAKKQQIRTDKKFNQVREEGAAAGKNLANTMGNMLGISNDLNNSLVKPRQPFRLPRGLSFLAQPCKRRLL